jgi:hypothetical protein
LRNKGGGDFNMENIEKDLEKGVRKITADMKRKIGIDYGNECVTGDFNSALSKATCYCGITDVFSKISGDNIIFQFTVKNIDTDYVCEREVEKFLSKFDIEKYDKIESDGEGFSEGNRYFRLPKFEVIVTISKKLFCSQAQQYISSSDLIPISKWKPYHTDDIGPLYYIGRWNGGQYAFKYNAKTNKLVVGRRGVYTPAAYTEYYEKGQRKQLGIFYLIKINNNRYYMSKYDAEKYFPDGLPEIYVDCY